MNQRDQNQGSGKRGGSRQEASSSGRQQGARQQGDFMQDEGREWQSQQRYGGSRMSASSAGQRFGETYNPEPQWLRDDRDSASAMRAREEEESGYRSSGAFSGRGSHAGSGSPWGEQQGNFRGQGGYDHQYASSQRDDPGYGSAYASRQSGQYESSQGGFGDVGSQQRYPRNMGGRGSQSGYGASRGGGGMHEYGTPGYETAGYDNDLGYSGQSMSGRGYGSQYRSGSSSGYGSGGYGSSSGYQLGSHQGDTGYQRSYRGMGPQDYKRPDDRIRDDVYERLTDSHEIDARSIMVDVNQGNVTLTGTVPERQMRYAAEDLVEACMGVSNINNQLKVQGTQSSQSTSSTAGSTGTGASASSTSTESKRH